MDAVIILNIIWKCLSSNDSSIIFIVSLLIIAEINKRELASEKNVWIKLLNFPRGAPATFFVLLYAQNCSAGHPVFMFFGTQV